MMARSHRRSVADNRCLQRFRRRRLLAFLRRDNLPGTFDALKHETRVFLDVRFLRRLVVRGRWTEARGYMNRFLPCREEDEELIDDAPAALRFITYLNVFDDLAHGKLGGPDAAEDLEMQIEAIPSTMADDSHYREAVSTVFHMEEPVEWQLTRLKASQIVKDLVTQTPEFRHLLRLPRCTGNPHYSILPIGFGGRHSRQQRKNIGRMSASLLAHRFLPKERRPPPRTQGSSSSVLMDDVTELIDETILAGKQVREHSDSCSEGSPVGSPTNAVTKCLDQESDAESAGVIKLPRTAGVFCSDIINGGINPKHVLEKVNALGTISDAMVTLLTNICTYGPDHNKFLEKLLEQEKLFSEMRVDCLKATAKGCTSIGMDFTT